MKQTNANERQVVQGMLSALLIAGTLWAAPDIQTPEMKLIWHRDSDSRSREYCFIQGNALVVFTGDGRIETRYLNDGKLYSEVSTGVVPAVRPSITGRNAFICGRDGSVGLYSMETGKVKWRVEKAASQFSGSTIDGDEVYFGTGGTGSKILAFELLNGKRRFVYPVPEPVLTAPSVHNDILYFGTLGGSLHALNIKTRLVVETYRTRGEFYGQPPVVAGGNILISPTGYHRRVECLDMFAAGKKKAVWSHSFLRDRYVNSADIYPAVFARPDMRRTLLRKALAKYGTNRDKSREPEQNFYALGPVHTSPWTLRGNEAAVVVKEPGIPPHSLWQLLVVDTRSGKELLRYERIDEGTPYLSSPAPQISRERIIAALGKGLIMSIDRETEDTEWEYELDGFVSDILLENDYLVGQSSTGAVSVFQFVYPPKVPLAFMAYRNMPNPFRRMTSFRYDIPIATKVSLRIYDAAGKMVAKIVDDVLKPGYYTAEWDATDSRKSRVSSGVYFARFSAGRYNQTIRMTLLK
jgi:hypothetical protein